MWSKISFARSRNKVGTFYPANAWGNRFLNRVNQKNLIALFFRRKLTPKTVFLIFFVHFQHFLFCRNIFDMPCWHQHRCSRKVFSKVARRDFFSHRTPKWVSPLAKHSPFLVRTLKIAGEKGLSLKTTNCLQLRTPSPPIRPNFVNFFANFSGDGRTHYYSVGNVPGIANRLLSRSLHRFSPKKIRNPF